MDGIHGHSGFSLGGLASSAPPSGAWVVDACGMRHHLAWRRLIGEDHPTDPLFFRDTGSCIDHWGALYLVITDHAIIFTDKLSLLAVSYRSRHEYVCNMLCREIEMQDDLLYNHIFQVAIRVHQSFAHMRVLHVHNKVCSPR